MMVFVSFGLGKTSVIEIKIRVTEKIFEMWRRFLIFNLFVQIFAVCFYYPQVFATFVYLISCFILCFSLLRESSSNFEDNKLHFSIFYNVLKYVSLVLIFIQGVAKVFGEWKYADIFSKDQGIIIHMLDILFSQIEMKILVYSYCVNCCFMQYKTMSNVLKKIAAEIKKTKLEGLVIKLLRKGKKEPYKIPKDSMFSIYFSKNILKIMNEESTRSAFYKTDSELLDKNCKWAFETLRKFEEIENIDQNVLEARKSLIREKMRSGIPKAAQEKTLDEEKVEKLTHKKSFAQKFGVYMVRLNEKKLVLMKILMQLSCFSVLLFHSERSFMSLASFFWLLSSFIVTDVVMLKA